MPWLALGLLVLLALDNLAGNPYGLPLWLFAVPVLLAVVALVLAVRAERKLDVVVSSLVVIAIPLWLGALVVLFRLVHFQGGDFSP